MKDKEFDHKALVQTVLDTDGELPGGEYNAIATTLHEKKKDFLDGDKTKKALLKRQVNVWAQNVLTYKNFRQDLAAGYNTGALMNTWADSREGKSVMSLLSDKPRLVEKKCPTDAYCAHQDELGIMMPNFEKVDELKETLENLDKEFNNAPVDIQKIYANKYLVERNNLVHSIDTGAEEWVAIPNLKSKIKLKDKATKDALRSMGNNYISKSTQVNPADNVEFNEPAARQQIRANIIGRSENKESLIYDDMGPGPFIDNIGLKIKKETGMKDDEQVSRVADEMAKNPKHKKLLNKELEDYFTEFLRRQWNMGKKNRPNPTGAAKVVESAKQPVQYKPGIIAASAKK
tara:strand:+ start:66 stop:1103 length:1038 start_codon:yes stop_codon:yes gene_type:complete